MFEAARRCQEIPSLTGRSRKPLESFTDLIERLHARSAQESVPSLIEQLLAEIDYLSLWRDHDNEIDQDRAANVHELINAARQYEQLMQEEEDDAPSLQGFLELASLTSEVDNVDRSRGAVTLMTMHAAKGLEFPIVYVLGLESGLIPHERAVDDGDPASFEEERRLLFVAVTRAQEELYLTQTDERSFRGQRRATISSIFVQEMPLVLDDELTRTIPVTAPQLDEQLKRARQRYEDSRDRPGLPALMSGTDLLKHRQHASPETIQPSRFPVGSTVRHPRYGRGTVVTTTGGTGRATVTVYFESQDLEQTFVANHCPLQPIG